MQSGQSGVTWRSSPSFGRLLCLDLTPGEPWFWLECRCGSSRCDDGPDVARLGEVRPSVRPVMSGTRKGEYEYGSSESARASCRLSLMPVAAGPEKLSWRKERP